MASTRSEGDRENPNPGSVRQELEWVEARNKLAYPIIYKHNQNIKAYIRGAAFLAIAQPFPSPLWIQLLLIATAAYLIGFGAVRSLAVMGSG